MYQRLAAFLLLGIPIIAIADDRLLVSGPNWKALRVADSTKLHFVGSAAPLCDITSTDIIGLIESAIISANIKPIEGPPSYDPKFTPGKPVLIRDGSFISEEKYPYLIVDLSCFQRGDDYIFALRVGFGATLFAGHNYNEDNSVPINGLVHVYLRLTSIHEHLLGISSSRDSLISTLKEELEAAVILFKKVNMADDYIGSCSAENTRDNPTQAIICF